MEFVAGRRLRRLGYDAPRVPSFPRPLPLVRYLQKHSWLRLKTRRRSTLSAPTSNR